MSDSVIKLSIVALLPVIAAVIIYLIDRNALSLYAKKSGAGRPENILFDSGKGDFASYRKFRVIRQLVIGVIFGAIAVIGTEYGIPMNGAMVNARDAAVLVAGFLFGGPAGITAGLIGGIERWIAVAWGVGTYTRAACTIATILAGFFAAGLRKFMFDDKKPGWLVAAAAAVVMEVFHLTMVFLTNMDDAARAMEVVQSCAIPMIIANAASVLLAVLLITIITKDRNAHGAENVRIAETIQRWLLISVAIAFLVTTQFMFFLQSNISDDNVRSLLALSIEDVKADIKDTSDTNLLRLTREVSAEISEYTGLTEAGGDIDSVNVSNLYLETLAAEHNVAEINVVNHHGDIVASTNPNFVGFNMNSGSQSAEFILLLYGETEMVQDYGPITYDPSIMRKYAGVSTGNGFVQVGYDATQFQSEIDAEVLTTARNRHVGETGSIMIAESDGFIVSAPASMVGKNLNVIGLASGVKDAKPNTVFKATAASGRTYYGMYDTSEGYYVISILPEAEAMKTRNNAMYLNTFIEIIVFAAMFALIYFFIKKLVVNNIRKVNRSLGRITGGDLEEKVNVRSNEEFASLSDDINSTVGTLKHYIEEAGARIDKELEFAKSIQYSALPSVFPAFPKRKEFDIYALMDTAKEVGGDFYDFYMTHNNVLNFLVADVSGKGIPAALFMMRSKVQLKSLTESDIPVSEVFTTGNADLCEGNDAGMFVTAWQGGIDLDSGLVKYANAGHNPPLVRHADGQFEYLKSRAGFVLAGMDGVKYKQMELTLGRGDIIFLYTDGVTEATNSNDELYGEDRLLEFLNTHEFADMKDLCVSVRADVAEFTGEADQFDDITMVALKYNGAVPKPEIHFDEAVIDDIPAVTEFVEAELEKMDCPMKAMTQISIAIDELYSNIAQYAYKSGKGPATVRVERAESPDGAIITFIDDGIPYNPLKKEDPDTTLSAEEREIGGLGIFMVKKSMDEMSYEYKDDKNILRIRKNF